MFRILSDSMIRLLIRDDYHHIYYAAYSTLLKLKPKSIVLFRPTRLFRERVVRGRKKCMLRTCGSRFHLKD